MSDTKTEPPPSMPERLVRRTVLTLAEAQAVVAAALAEASNAGCSVTVAVQDDGGHVIALGRADGCSLVAVDMSLVKARTAILFGSETAHLPAAQPMVGIMGAAATTPVALVPGGVPLARDGVLIGAVGVAGGPPEIDRQAARAGAAALPSRK